jgi:hypothetical protein
MKNEEFRMKKQIKFFILHSSFCLCLRFRLRLAQTGDAVAVFALTAFFEKFRAFKTLENITFAAQSGRRAETAML